jgi:hypothetical protein
MHHLEVPPEELRALYHDLLQRRLGAIELLSKIEEPELILLKGHLLIEEVLFALLGHKMRKSSSLEKARLSFAQIVSLVEGLYDGEDLNQSWLYAACHQLNKIRNRLAHNVRPDGLDQDINHFTAFVLGHMTPDFSPKNPLRYAIGSIHANFSALLTLHKKIGLIPAPLQGMSFESLLTVSKVLAKNGTSDA